MRDSVGKTQTSSTREGSHPKAKGIAFIVSAQQWGQHGQMKEIDPQRLTERVSMSTQLFPVFSLAKGKWNPGTSRDRKVNKFGQGEM